MGDSQAKIFDHNRLTRAVRDVNLRQMSFLTIRVTKDEDFVERALQAQVSPQILWLRIGNNTNRVFVRLVGAASRYRDHQPQTGQRLVELRQVR